MSQNPIELSPDLTKIRNEGYSISIIDGMLVLENVPYLDSNQKVQFGTLISELNLESDYRTHKPKHTVFFDGEYPHHKNGTPIIEIQNCSKHFEFGAELSAKHRFSSKPECGYNDYHHKMTTYATILSAPAEGIDDRVSPRALRKSDNEDNDVFCYTDNASGRIGISKGIKNLKSEIVAIIGIGGSGSYILDLVSKVSVKEIRIFDGDQFLQHNAFRAPGAASIKVLRNAPLKTQYFSEIYSQMHQKIIPHHSNLNKSNLDLLDGVSFAFLAMDASTSKSEVIEKLENIHASFIDVGMGVEITDDSLSGILRGTVSTENHRELFHSGIVPIEADDEDAEYSSNIQIAELNSLIASLAVIKWKKIRGFYRDIAGEHHFAFATNNNKIMNRELKDAHKTA